LKRISSLRKGNSIDAKWLIIICLVFKEYAKHNCGMLSRAIFKQVGLFLTSNYNWKTEKYCTWKSHNLNFITINEFLFVTLPFWRQKFNLFCFELKLLLFTLSQNHRVLILEAIDFYKEKMNLKGFVILNFDFRNLKG
jgi:hypothetical protein